MARSTSPGPLARWRALPVVARDAVGAGALVALAVVEQVVERPADRAAPGALLLALGATATLALRRARPAVPLVATAVALLVAVLVSDDAAAPVLAALVAVYSAVAWGRRRLGLLVAVVACTVVAAATGARAEQAPAASVGIVVAAWGVAVALGLAAASRRAVVDAARERARRAEQTRELEAARRVTEERLRIARELHDVIGHHAAVVGVQAAVAARLLESRPDDARASLRHVQDAGRAVLDELGALVRVLRGPDDGDGPPAAPAPRLAELAALVAEARASGLGVTCDVRGTPGPLPPVVDLAAYRIVQESLTNARKHGAGTARVTVEHLPDALVLTVTNPLPPSPRPAAEVTCDDGTTGRGGYGLVGLRERTGAVGGSLVTLARGGTFTLAATLPVPRPAPALARAVPTPGPTPGPPDIRTEDA